MRSLHKFVLAIAAAVPLTLSLSAQSSTSTQQPSQEMQGMQEMQGQQGRHAQMRGMMENCHKRMQSMMQEHSKVKADIRAAKQSNDLTKMRSALNEAEQSLNAMDHRMNICMGMMDRMQNMQGMGGMMGGQQSKPQTQSPPSE